MKIISGDEFGILKLISTKSKSVQDTFGVLNAEHEVLSVIKSPLTTSMEDLHLFVTELKANYVLDWNTKEIKSIYQNESSSFTSSILKHNANKNILISSNKDNTITTQIINDEYNYESTSTKPILENPNPNLHIRLNRICDSSFPNSDCIYGLFENTPLAIYNIEKNKIEFRGKNVPNDELNLRIPMYDTYAVESVSNPRNVYVSTAYGDIRLYDKKASPRPVQNIKVSKNKINKIIPARDENCLIMCDVTGYCAMLDVRKKMVPVKNFRGNTGSVRDIVNIQERDTLIAGGLDRYVRWYDYKSGNNETCFAKNRITSLCVVDIEEVKEDNDDDDDDEGEEIDDSEFDEEEENEEGEEEGEDEEGNEEEENEEEGDEEEDNEDEEIEEEEEEEKPKKVKSKKESNKKRKP